MEVSMICKVGGHLINSIHHLQINILSWHPRKPNEFDVLKSERVNLLFPSLHGLRIGTMLHFKRSEQTHVYKIQLGIEPQEEDGVFSPRPSPRWRPANGCSTLEQDRPSRAGTPKFRRYRRLRRASLWIALRWLRVATLSRLEPAIKGGPCCLLLHLATLPLAFALRNLRSLNMY